VILSLLNALALASTPVMPSLPFAGGPKAQVGLAIGAVKRCRVRARFHDKGETEVLIFISDGERRKRRIDCLSQWIASQPDGGFQRYGFIGREQP
jgi:hypothetical protein